MTNREIISRIDHTLLKAAASWEEVRNLCDEAARYGTASVCIPPVYVKRARETFGDALVIGTVAGFPLGYSLTSVKALEAERALAAGASEIDMVINIAEVKNGNFDAVLEEIRALRETVGDKVLKVIVETCYLTEEEKTRLCGITAQAGADYIKTSTGFGAAGAALEDIRLFKGLAGGKLKIKAAGGIRTREAMEAFINEGCDRLGTSAAGILFAGL